MSSRITVYPATGEQAFLDADHTKLNGIEALADITPQNLSADLAGSRASGTIYQNTGSKTMFVVIQGNHSVGTDFSGTAYVNSFTPPTVFCASAQMPSGYRATLTFFVPPAYYYKAVLTATSYTWFEVT